MKSLNDTFKIIELTTPLYNANQGESFLYIEMFETSDSVHIKQPKTHREQLEILKKEI